MGKRVLFIGRQFHPCVGGTETFMLEYANEMIGRGDEVSVLVLNRDLFKGTKLPRLSQYQDINIYRVPYVGSPRMPIAAAGYKTIWKLFQWADVVHIHDVRFLLEISLLFGWLLKKPVIFETYGMIFHTKKYARFKRLYFRYYLTKLLRKVDSIISVSQQDHELVSPFFKKGFVELVEAGVNCKRYAQLAKNIIPGKLVYLGRLDVHKGVDLLLRALAKVDRFFELTVIYGSALPEVEGRLKVLCNQLKLDDRVRWRGYCSEDEVKQQFSEAMFNVFPSQYDGFGISRLEAMATGTPIIANDIPTIRQTINDGKDGFIIPFNNTEEASRRLDEALALDVATILEMGVSAKKNAQAYDWSVKVDQIESIYEKVIYERSQARI